MRGTEKRVLLVAFGLVVGLPPTTVAAQVPVLPDPVRLELARSLVALLRPSESAIAVLERQVAALGAGDITLSAEVLAEAKMDMDRLDEVLAGIYARHLTADEFRGLIEFYETPLGRRAIELQPILARDAMTASTQLVMNLMQRLFDRAGVQIPPAT